ncbi:hypothetical protein JTE90_019966 [Oedothorax gibbosus]|uniref:Uncharacterized protein n=1 Tax=Oedothorax gibbosus TaxID=931172 RepID=A0AAV6TKF9_9ARAC|nr:hypothetical protein JTE90_019966 [Oedothorax gibbosus]
MVQDLQHSRPREDHLEVLLVEGFPEPEPTPEADSIQVQEYAGTTKDLDARQEIATSRANLFRKTNRAVA